MLLRFRVSNHRSIRDEQELSLVSAARRGESTPTGSFPPTVRVAGIYGANASGKSNVLDALGFLRSAIRESYSKWPAEGGVPRRPFLLGLATAARSSTYEIDIALEGVRYTYGFEVDDDRVISEWLHAYHVGSRKRTLFSRELDSFHFGRSLTGSNNTIARLTRKNALYLSVAAANRHSLLGGIYFGIKTGLWSVYMLGQGSPGLHDLARTGVVADRRLRSKVRDWLRLADLGIVGFELKSVSDAGNHTMPWEEVFRELGEDAAVSLGRDFRDIFSSELTLLHSRGPGGLSSALSFDDESAGTQVWLAILAGVTIALRVGGVFPVDEVDSSLHPRLSAALIQIFKDPLINPKGAQLIFTSHDVSLLGNLVEGGILNRDEVWFTEKDSDGATRLFPLSDFHPRKGENFERAYLQGRYGAVPYVDISELRKVFADKDAS